MSIKDRIQQDMKDAMRAKDKARLGTIRLILAAIKQREVDERMELDDEQVIVVLDKMGRRWTRKIDIYMGDDVGAAKRWGVRPVRIHWRSPLPAGQ